MQISIFSMYFLILHAHINQKKWVLPIYYESFMMMTVAVFL